MKILTLGIIGFLIGFLNGIFGAGGGALLVIFLEKFMKLETHKAHATSISIILPLTIVSSLIYFKNLEINLQILLFTSIGGLIGGFLGSKYLNKISSNLLHKLFGIFMIISSIKLIL